MGGVKFRTVLALASPRGLEYWSYLRNTSIPLLNPYRGLGVVHGEDTVGPPKALYAPIRVGNAWKFTGKQPRARIEFGVTEHEGMVAYFVRDDGVGFDITYADKLFGVFQRLHHMDEFEGTGIGLATVARIMRRPGGRVWAEGEVGRGATISFTLWDSADFTSPPSRGAINGGGGL
jgi:hypothetical protein